MARMLVSLALAFSLGNPVFGTWVEVIVQAATTDAGNLWDPKGSTGPAGGQGDPAAATPDYGSLWDPNG
jgi:hypothetical protein